MITRSWNVIKDIVEKKDSIVLFGGGRFGTELMYLLKYAMLSDKVKWIFDNNSKKIGRKICGVEIRTPSFDLIGDSSIIITVGEKGRDSILEQLNDMGVDQCNIYQYYSSRWDMDYANLYLKGQSRNVWMNEISDLFRESFGRELDWDNPKTYNEIINHDKLFSLDERKTVLCDKYFVRNWVEEQIGKRYLPKLYGVWKNPEEIDFSLLPNRFVLKVSIGSGSNIIVKDKSLIDEKRIITQLSNWLKIDCRYVSMELHGSEIKNASIICEEYLEGILEESYDYKIFCFHGNPKYVQCIKGEKTPENKAAFYDIDWNKLPVTQFYPMDEDDIPIPQHFDELIEIASKLSSGFEHVRVDLYDIPRRGVMFGEMTFSNWGGIIRFEPGYWDYIFGADVLNSF